MSRRRIQIRNHSFLPDGEYLYYRFVMAEKIGRKLRRNEIVHHKDENHSNDRRQNLRIVTHKQHAKIHLKGKKRSQITRDRISKAQIGKPKKNGPAVSKALKGRKWSKTRCRNHSSKMKAHFTVNPKVAPTGRPWVKLKISRRTWYRWRDQ